MFLESIASAFPKFAYTQSECLEFSKDTTSFRNLSARGLGIVGRVLSGDSGIAKRHFSTGEPAAMFDAGAQELGRLYAGDWMFIPYSAAADTDITITPSVATTITLEYMAIYHS